MPASQRAPDDWPCFRLPQHGRRIAVSTGATPMQGSNELTALPLDCCEQNDPKRPCSATYFSTVPAWRYQTAVLL